MGDPKAPPLDAAALLTALNRHGVEYVIVGGLAAVAHGSGRMTFDIDIVPAWTSANLDRVASALREVGAALRIDAHPDAVAFPIDTAALRQFEVSTWRTRFGDIDIIIGIPTATRGVLAGYDALAATAASRTAFGLTILVADLDDVINSKIALGRPPDLAALPELHRLRDRTRRPPPDTSDR